mmetsp:Transcript_40444/g.97621  ORF Transcript_40444/g.97621 Transcript_40444/m.97621 type:complete len:422 (+) Transcript_40444:110-1375(+)
MTENNVLNHAQATNILSEMEEDPVITSSLSQEKEKVLALWMIVAGCLSTIGCFFTMHRISKKSTKKTNSYDRIMFALSGFNMITGITYIMTPFLLPSDGPSPRIWSIGNQVSCSFLGWLTQLSFASVSYTCALSFYFLAAIKFRISMDDFAIRFEAYIHGLTVFFFLFTATAGFPLQMYDAMNVGMSCWIKEEFPKKCMGDDCIGNTVGWFFGGWIIFVAFVALFVNHLLVWMVIRQKLAGVRRKGVETPSWAIRIRRSSNQALLYVLAFYLTNSTPVVLGILEQRFGFNDPSREHELYKFLVAHSFLVPLQGFLNTFIHARPNYLKLRASEYPIGVSFWLAALHNRVDDYVDGYGGESDGASSGSPKSKEDLMLSRLEHSIAMISEVIPTEELSKEGSNEWGLQVLRKISMTIPNTKAVT